MRRLFLTLIIGLVIFGVVAWYADLIPSDLYPSWLPKGPNAVAKGNQPGPKHPKETEKKAADLGSRLYQGKPVPEGPATREKAGPDPVVLPQFHVTVIQKADVPSRNDGRLLFVGKLVDDKEKDSPGVLPAVIYQAGEPKPVYYRPLHEGDFVKPDEMVALVDPTLALNAFENRKAKVLAAKADHLGSLAMAQVYKGEMERLDRIRSGGVTGAVSDQEYQVAKAQYRHYLEEANSKKAAITVAEKDVLEAKTMLELHTIKNPIFPPKNSPQNLVQIKSVLKSNGEAVKGLEPVLVVQDLGRLRAEGLVDVQSLPAIQQGMAVYIQPTQRRDPLRVFRGHQGEITALAVSGDTKDPFIVSGSEDGTVRVWKLTERQEHQIWHLPAAVRAVACSPKGATDERGDKVNYCLIGCADGSVQLRNLDVPSEDDEKKSVVWSKPEQAGDAVNCIAFSPDGKVYVTGGEDNSITLWRTKDGTKVYAFDADQGHQGGVTSVHFTPDLKVVSAGRDNALKVWTLYEHGAKVDANASMANRGGNVTHLGVSADGRFMLYDQGKTLQVMSVARGRTVGAVQDPTGGTPFEGLAEFSPDGSLVLTASSAEGRLQLWRAPTDPGVSHAYEVRQYLTREASRPTCAAFGTDVNLPAWSDKAREADQTFAVTGSRDGLIYLWGVPARKLVEKRITGKVSLKEPFVEPSTRQARVWVDAANEDGLLIPGETVTVVVPRGQAAKK